MSDGAIVSEDYDGRPGCNLCGPCDLGCPTGARSSADVTFWPRALRHGVSVAPGHFASPADGHDHLRLCHDRPDAELAEGAARLAAAWSETAPARVLA